MKRSEVKIGDHVIMRVGNNYPVCRLDEIRQSDLVRRTVTTFYLTNLVTGRKVTAHAASKFRRFATEAEIQAVQKKGK